MADSGKGGWGGRIPANDNGPEGEAEGGEDSASLEKLDRVVLDCPSSEHLAQIGA